METPAEPHLITFPRIEDPRGNLSFIEGGKLLPFEIERVYWTYDIPSDSTRHGRALRTCAEVVIATSGCFEVTVDRGNGSSKRYTLRSSNTGLYIPPMTWRTIDGFVTGSTCLTIASKLYDEDDYIRDYQLFTASLTDELRQP